MAVEYRDIKGFPGYRVGDDGSVWSCWTKGHYVEMTSVWHQIHGGVAKGHQYVWLFDENRKRHFWYVHHIVLETFVGPCPEGQEGLHANDDGMDNRLVNLRWGTRRENAADAVRNGRYRRGERSSSSVLTEADVVAMRRLRPQMTFQAIADKFGVTIGTAFNAIRGSTWGHVKEGLCAND